MRVMIVGGNQMKYMASRYYDYANKLGNGFTRNNHMVVRFFDRDVARLENFSPDMCDIVPKPGGENI